MEVSNRKLRASINKNEALSKKRIKLFDDLWKVAMKYKKIDASDSDFYSIERDRGDGYITTGGQILSDKIWKFIIELTSNEVEAKKDNIRTINGVKYEIRNGIAYNIKK